MLRVPIKHGEGQFVASAGELDRIERDGLVVLPILLARAARSSDAYNPNGAARTRSPGVRNEAGNVSA